MRLHENLRMYFQTQLYYFSTALCTKNGKRCFVPVNYKNATFTTCLPSNHNREASWCYTSPDKQRWGYCGKCPKNLPTTTKTQSALSTSQSHIDAKIKTTFTEKAQLATSSIQTATPEPNLPTKNLLPSTRLTTPTTPFYPSTNTQTTSRNTLRNIRTTDLQSTFALLILKTRSNSGNSEKVINIRKFDLNLNRIIGFI